MRVDVAVVGGPFLDLVFEGLPRLPAEGQEIVGRALHVVPGGSAIQAIGIARLGLPVTLVSPRGDDPAGRLIRAVLDEEGVRWVGPSTDRSAATAILSTPSGTAMATAPAPGDPGPADVADVDPAIVVLSLRRASLRPSGVPACFVSGSVEVEAGIGLPATVPGDTLVVNAREAMELTGEATVDTAVRALGRRCETAVVTTGADGAVGVRGGDVARAPAPDVEAVDATGAGDLFVAGIVWATRRGLPLEQALAWACLYAGLSVSSPSALDGARRLDELLDEGRRRGLSPP